MNKQKYGVLRSDTFLSIQLLKDEDISEVNYNCFILLEEIYKNNGNGQSKITFLDDERRLLNLNIRDWRLNPDAKMHSDWAGYYFFFEFIAPNGNKKQLRSHREGLTIFKHHGIFDEELKFAFEKLKELSAYPDWSYHESLVRIKELEEENENLKREIESLKIK